MNNTTKLLSLKQLCLLSLLILISGFYSPSYGQKVKLEVSPEYKLEKKKRLYSHLYSDESGHYMYFMQLGTFLNPGTEVYLEKYNDKFKQVFSKEYKADQRDMFSLEMRYMNNQFVWLIGENDKKNDRIKFYLTPISLQGKASKPINIANFEYSKKSRTPGVDFYMNQDTSKMLFIAENDYDSKKENYEVYLSVIDSSLNKDWSKIVKLPYEQKRVEVGSWTITDTGDVYFLAKIYDEMGGRLLDFADRTPDYTTKIYKISNGEDPKEFELNLGDAFIKDIKIKKNEFNNFSVCIAFISNKNKGPIQGIAYLKLSNETNEVEYSKKRMFTEKEIDSFGRKNTKKGRSNVEGLNNSFLFRDIIFEKDGTFTCLIEEYRVVVKTTTNSNGSSSTSTDFFNNHIVVIHFENDGNVDHIGLVPKKFKTHKGGLPMRDPKIELTTDYMFYTPFKTENHIYFLYNDDKINFKRGVTDPDKYKVLRKFNNAVAVIAYFDENNKLKRKELFDKNDFDALLMPKHSVQINDNQVFFYCRRSRFLSKADFQFGVMTITD